MESLWDREVSGMFVPTHSFFVVIWGCTLISSAASPKHNENKSEKSSEKEVCRKEKNKKNPKWEERCILE